MGPFSFEEACALHGVYEQSHMLADQMPTGKRRFTADNGL